MKRLILILMAGMMMGPLFAASLPVPESLGEHYRYVMIAGSLYAVPPAMLMPLLANPNNADQVLVASWNSANTSGFPGALAVAVSSTAPPSSNPTNANQVLTNVWNSALNALNIYCVSGCGGGGGGGGNVNNSGTPANHQIPIWINATTIKGLAIPASGTLFQGVAAADPAWTATPALGVASMTTGTLGFHGAGGTGTITLTPPTTGNLGTVSVKIPPTAGTLATTATAPVTLDATTGAVGCSICTTASNTQTFTNKTFDTAGTGNSLKVNGTAITAVSGTGAVCLASGSACAGGGGLTAPWSQSTVSIIGASTAVLNLTAATRLTPPQTAQGTTDGDLHYDTTAHRLTHYDSGATAVQTVADVADLSVISPTFATQTDGSTVTWAIASSIWSNASLTFTTHGGSRTLDLTGLVNGGRYQLELIQDGTGGEGLTLGTGCTWVITNGGGGAITLTNAPSALDILSFFYDGTRCVGVLNPNAT